MGAIALAPNAAAAHTSSLLLPGDVFGGWSLEPWSLLWLGLVAWLYARGVGRLWRRAGAGRGISRRQFWSFCWGMVTLAAALLSPLHGIGGVLFSAHMLQHELLMLVGAPLIVLGTPWVAFAWAAPRGYALAFARFARSSPVGPVWRVISRPVPAAAVHAAVLWIWHVPDLYDATISNRAIHTVQHLGFFGSALLLWWAVLRRSGGARAAGGAALVIFVTMIHSNALGALLTFAARPWYPAYELSAPRWGFSPLEDQQLGGLLMWIPAGLIYLGAALALLSVYLMRGDPGEGSRPARLQGWRAGSGAK